ncbi:hypothetical protein MASR2M78_34470 [Treponema sp.]
MRKSIVLVFSFLLVSSLVFSQASPKKILDQKSLDKFLLDFPKMDQDASTAEVDIGGDFGDEEPDFGTESFAVQMKKTFDSLKQNPEARKVIAKYGWDNRYWDILFAISLSYTYISLEEGFAGTEMPPQLKPMFDEVKNSVHKDDVALVKKNQSKIELMFGDDD